MMNSSVTVVLRIRKEEREQCSKIKVEATPDGKQCVYMNNDNPFLFDKVLKQNSSQLDTYNAVVANGIDHCLAGYNLCVLAYGQTGSGKTYSIAGVEDYPGVLPYFGQNLFRKIKEDQLEENVYVSLSYYEVYQEKVYDLFSSIRKPMRIRGATDNIYIEGLTEVGVKDVDELEQWRQDGLSRRATAATLMNDISSRSHAVFCIKIHREYPNRKCTVASNCYFVDLAGSEKTSISGDLFSESVAINQSLLALQRVVDARSSNQAFVNYRDSILTRLLRNCFDGNSITTLLATISPLESFGAETLNTLRFASKASSLVQMPTINEKVDGESVETLRDQNRYYLRKIAEMEAQIKTLKMHSANEQMRAPAVLELFPDESLNRWTELCNKTTFSPLDDLKLAEYSKSNNQWMLNVVADGVYVNGVALLAKSVKELKHGDIISFFDRKFCAVYLDGTCEVRKFINYDRAKLIYVEAVHEKQQKEIIDRIVEQTKLNEKEVRDALEEESKLLREELDVLKTKYKSSSGEEKQNVKKEYEKVESIISNTEDMKKNLKLAVLQQTEELQTRKNYSEADKKKQVDFRSKVEVMNSLLNVTGKSKMFEFRYDGLNSVKLFNKNQQTFAELSSEHFLHAYNHFADLYQSNNSREDISDDFNKVVYSSRYVWKQVRAGVGSSLLKQAVFNTLQETARKRRSTYAEVTYGFTSRRSVIGDIIQSESQRPTENPVDEFLQHLSFYALNTQNVADSQEELSSLNIIHILLNACSAARKDFDTFILPENFSTTSSYQKKAVSVVGVYRSIGDVNLISLAAQSCFIMPCVVDIGLDYIAREMIERSNCLRQLIESWINSVREGSLAKEQGKLILNEMDRLVQNVGFLAFYLGIVVEPDSNLVEEYEKGIISAMKDFTADVPEILEKCANGTTTLNKFRKLAATFVIDLMKYAEDAFDTKFVFDVVRKAVILKESITCTTEDLAGKFIGDIEGIIDATKEFSSVISDETFQLLDNGLEEWRYLSHISAKPPHPVKLRPMK